MNSSIVSSNIFNADSITLGLFKSTPAIFNDSIGFSVVPQLRNFI